jgi:hypothetical protein
MLAKSSVREALATRIVFFVAGLAVAARAPLVPFLKAGGGFDDKSLGLLLLLIGFGSIIGELCSFTLWLPQADTLFRSSCGSVISCNGAFDQYRHRWSRVSFVRSGRWRNRLRNEFAGRLGRAGRGTIYDARISRPL